MASSEAARALASFLDARKNNGQWLVRVEDIDPLREIAGASSHILHTLESHHLLWDESVRYQSESSAAYEAFIEQLRLNDHTYFCPCSRKLLSANNGVHGVACNPKETSVPQNFAVRFRANDQLHEWHDLILGLQRYQSKKETDDFVIKRKEGFYAYQLAVVCDDIDQKISHIIRGSDLLDSTPPQLALYQTTGTTIPYFGHIPVILNDAGQKLSKQNLAPAINNQLASNNLQLALQALNHPIPKSLQGASPNDIIQWATTHWSIEKLPKALAIQGGWNLSSEL
jgi:glutamyl-Q tRNA(Asp) synthetase